MSFLARLRNEGRDLLELVVAPGLAAVLPWPMAFRIFRWLCKYDLFYRDDCNEALAQARARGWVRTDPAAWLQARRLVTLVDHADFYLARTRSDRWMARHLLVLGDWPDPAQPAILCTFHWGAGMWGLRHAGSRGLHAHAMIAAHSPETFRGRRVRYWYFGRRIGAVAAALRRSPIEVASSLRPILQALRAGEPVVAAVDVPSDQVAGSESIDFLGLRARVPRGLLRVAADSKVPVTVFLTGIRLRDGKRTLHIHRLPPREDVEALMVEVFALLQQAIENEPEAWHFWQVAPRFFVATEPAAPESIGQGPGEAATGEAADPVEPQAHA